MHNNIKKVLFISIICLLIIIPIAQNNVQAASIDVAQDKLKNLGNKIFGTKESDIAIVIGRVIQIILGLVGILFTILIIYGGFLYMTAAGNQEQVGKARTLIKDAAIGIAIVITAFGITNFVVFGLLESIKP